jgi:uncharacterized protein (DUF2267 family)
MTYEDFIHAVAARAEVPEEQAGAIAGATLETLAERISGGQAEDLAAQPEVPNRLADHLRKTAVREDAEPFGLDEFVRRVSMRAGVDGSMAQAGAHAVFATLRDAVPAYEFNDMQAQLSKDYWAISEPVITRGFR